jgi:hypothetical protein
MSSMQQLRIHKAGNKNGVFFHLLVMIISMGALNGCSSASNETLYTRLTTALNETAIRNKAIEYSYQHDPFTPQTNFLIDGKLKYISYTFGPDDGREMMMAYFNLVTDSVDKFVLRSLDFHRHDNSLFSNTTDTLYMLYPKSNRTEIYVGGAITKIVSNVELLYSQLPFLHQMKQATEKMYASESPQSSK